MEHAAIVYARKITSGEKPSVLTLRQACARFLQDLKDSGREDYPYWFDKDLANRFRDFCKRLLKVEDPVKGDGTEVPMTLTPFQEFISAQLFGWVHKETGARRFRETYWEISKGSGKSPLAAAIMLYLLVADGERDAMIQLCARTYEQAGVVSRAVEAFLNTSPSLRARVQTFSPNDPKGFIYKGPTGILSRIVRIGTPTDKDRAAKGMSGPRPSGAVIDEVHELQSDAVYQSLILGQKNRRQPLIIMATNSGRSFETPVGRIHKRARSVLKGSLDDPTFLPIVIVADEGTDPMADESLWPALHPDLDYLLPRSTLRQHVKRAKGSPDQAGEVKRLFFGTWSPKSANTLFDTGAWRAVEVLPKDWPSEKEMGLLPCFLGLDLSKHDDLSALAAVWVKEEEDETPTVYARVWPFLPECDLDALYARTQVDYPSYHKGGHLILAGTDRIEYEHIAWVVGELMDQNRVMGMAYDRWNMPNFRAAMERRKVDHWVKKERYPRWRGAGVELVEHGQGLSPAKSGLMMETSIKALEKWVLNKNMRAWYNPLLRHHVVDGGEVEYGRDGLSKNRRFIASEKRIAKNDCLVALTQACGLAQRYLNLSPNLRNRMFVKPEDRKMGYDI